MPGVKRSKNYDYKSAGYTKVGGYGDRRKYMNSMSHDQKAFMMNAPPRYPSATRLTLPAIQRTSAVEVRTLDIPSNVLNISTTPTFTLLNPIQEGSSFYQRNGRKVTAKSLRLTGQLGLSGASSGVNKQYLRVMVIYDRQPPSGGGFPAISDILQVTDQAGNNTTDSLSGMNMNNSERFAMLRDIRYDLQSGGSAVTPNTASLVDYNNERIRIDEYVKIPLVDMHYNSTANPMTPANISTGALYLVTFGNEAVATAPYAINWTSRLRFVDL